MVPDDEGISSVEAKTKLEYMKELLMDKMILSSDSNRFHQLHKILDKEILHVRSSLFSMYGIHIITDNDLPEPVGPKVNLQAKVYMPVDANNCFNFVGRILGPDGSTAKCLQQCLGVKIMVRGRGSMRDRRKEEAYVGKPKWEHLNDNLHVVLTVEDSENRGKVRLAKASECIKLFLNTSMKSDREDKVKQMQLMELAFRRERQVWQFGCTELSNFGTATKLSHLFHNANLMNFGYGYPSFYPSMTTQQPAASHNPVGSGTATATLGSHHHPPHLSQGPQSTNSQLCLLQHATGSGQQPGLAHPFASSLSPNMGPAMFVGHGPAPPAAATFHTASYSPNPQAMQLPGSLAVASMNYWTPVTAPGQLNPLAQEYHVLSQYNQPQQPQPQKQQIQPENQNQSQSQEQHINVSCVSEFTTSPSMETSPNDLITINTSASMSNVSQLPLTTVFMAPTPHPISQHVTTLQSEQVHPSLIPNFQLCSLGDCSLASSKEYDANAPMLIHPSFTGLYGQLPPNMVANANKVQQQPQMQQPLLGLEQAPKQLTGLLSTNLSSVTSPSSTSASVVTGSLGSSKNGMTTSKTRQNSQKQSQYSVANASTAMESSGRAGRVNTAIVNLRLDEGQGNTVQTVGDTHASSVNTASVYGSKTSLALGEVSASSNEFGSHIKKNGNQTLKDMSQSQPRSKTKMRSGQQRTNAQTAKESNGLVHDNPLSLSSLVESEVEWPKLGPSIINKQQIEF